MILAAHGDFAAKGRALGSREELLRNNGLDGEGIAERIRHYESTAAPGAEIHKYAQIG
jgi:hypothetical protein